MAGKPQGEVPRNGELVSMSEAARRVGVSRDFIRNNVEIRGYGSASRYGRGYMVDMADVRKAVQLRSPERRGFGLLTVAEACRKFGVSRGRLDRAIRNGGVPIYRTNVMVRSDDVEAWATAPTEEPWLERYNAGASVDDICKLLGIGKRQLQRKFKAAGYVYDLDSLRFVPERRAIDPLKNRGRK